MLELKFYVDAFIRNKIRNMTEIENVLLDPILLAVNNETNEKL